MSKKKAGIILSSIILIVVVTINLLFGGKDSEEVIQEQPQQVVNTQEQPQQPTEESIIKEPVKEVVEENKELNLEQPTTTDSEEEKIQNIINEKIKEGIAVELAKLQQEQTTKAIDNTQQKQPQQETPVEDKNNNLVVQTQPVEEVKVLQDGTISNIAPDDLTTVVFTKTESVTIVTKTIKKVSVEGVIMTVYELGTEGSTYPLKLLVNNSAFISVKEGDSLNVTYNIYRGNNGEDIVNIVKVS